jgi:hypothetical protein
MRSFDVFLIGTSDFVVSKVTPNLESDLGWKLFMMFGTINIGGMAVFSLLIPETKGRSLEEMDIIFGSVTREERQAYIEREEKGKYPHDKVQLDDVLTSYLFFQALHAKSIARPPLPSLRTTRSKMPCIWSNPLCICI